MCNSINCNFLDPNLKYIVTEMYLYQFVYFEKLLALL
jgi:hypothetical protein